MPDMQNNKLCKHLAENLEIIVRQTCNFCSFLEKDTVILSKKLRNQSRTNGPINAHLTIAQV